MYDSLGRVALENERVLLWRISKLLEDRILFAGQGRALTRIALIMARLRSLDFMSTADLAAYTWEWAKGLPHDVDCVVAIPRQGILAGWAASLFLDAPLSTPEMLVNH